MVEPSETSRTAALFSPGRSGCLEHYVNTVDTERFNQTGQWSDTRNDVYFTCNQGPVTRRHATA
jgi:hypothetical protein